MNSIPLIKGNTPQEINTSIIALKKALSELEAQDRLLQGTDKDVQDKIKQINELIEGINTHLGTVDSHLTAIDGQITALQPVDTVTSGNMHSVTSNAVAQALGDSLGEQRIGTWIDGSPLYKKAIVFNIPQNGEYSIPIDVSNFKNLVKWSGNFFQGGYQAPVWIMHIPYTYIDQLSPSDILNIYVYFNPNTLSFMTSFYGLGQYSSGYYNGQGILYIEYTKNN